MEPMKNPNGAEWRIFDRLEKADKNPAAWNGAESGLLLQTAKSGGRHACQVALFVCMMLHVSRPAEAASGSVPSPAAILSSGEPPPGRRYNAAFAIKRPKPGSIWNGPRELWCLLPHGHGASEAASPESSEPPALPTEPPPPRPEVFPPPPYLSPLMLFLITMPTLKEVASYFAEALGETPVIEGEQKLRFERCLVFKWGSSWRRCVLSGAARAGPGVTLDWSTNDDFGLSELREFFEAPFFRQCESIRFYQWLGEGGEHEGDFRGHRLRMAVQRRDSALFVRIQWWRSAPEAESSDAPVELETPDSLSSPLALVMETEPDSGSLTSLGFNLSERLGTGFRPSAAPLIRVDSKARYPSGGISRCELIPRWNNCGPSGVGRSCNFLTTTSIGSWLPTFNSGYRRECTSGALKCAGPQPPSGPLQRALLGNAIRGNFVPCAKQALPA